MVGARDLNPRPHGPEICAVSSTEAVFEGFELDWERRSCPLGRFGPITGARITTRTTTCVRQSESAPSAWALLSSHKEDAREGSAGLTTVNSDISRRAPIC